MPWRWSVAEYSELLKTGGGRERLLPFLEHPDLRKPVGELRKLAADLHQRKTYPYQQIVTQGEMPLRRGIRRLLGAAREAGVRLAIATTSAASAVRALLVHTLGSESLGWFDCIAAGEMVSHKKPAPDVYRYVLDCLAIEARQAIAIEDSQPGLRAALGANLAVVVTHSEFTHQHDFSSAAAVLDQLGDPGVACRQFSGCVDLQPMVTLENLEHLLSVTCGSPAHES